MSSESAERWRRVGRFAFEVNLDAQVRDVGDKVLEDTLYGKGWVRLELVGDKLRWGGLEVLEEKKDWGGPISLIDLPDITEGRRTLDVRALQCMDAHNELIPRGWQRDGAEIYAAAQLRSKSHGIFLLCLVRATRMRWELQHRQATRMFMPSRSSVAILQ